MKKHFKAVDSTDKDIKFTGIEVEVSRVGDLLVINLKDLLKYADNPIATDSLTYDVIELYIGGEMVYAFKLMEEFYVRWDHIQSILNDNELWSYVIDHPEYKISTLGRIMSLKYGKQEMLKPGTTINGYYTVTLDGKGLRVNQLVAQAFIPNPENKPFTDHRNKVRDDNRVQNLRWRTPKENSQNKTPWTHSRTEGIYVGLYKEGLLVEAYTTQTAAAHFVNPERFETAQKRISECCREIRNSYKGYTYGYLTTEEYNAFMESK